MKNKISVALIANTGMGNEVLKALLNCQYVFVDSLCTRRMEGDFPYYVEEEIEDFAVRNGIKCFTNVNVNEQYFEYLQTREIDIILVASFHQILKSGIIQLPILGIINIHPSLLPHYRGPSPLSWVILNGERKTGITAHYLTEKIDAGNILLQEEVDISNLETLGSLFKKISIRAGQMIEELLNNFNQSSHIPKGIPQSEVEATYWKKPDKLSREISDHLSFDKAFRIIRAFHPNPGAIFNVTGEEHRVIDYRLSDPGLSDYKSLTLSSKKIFLLTERIK